MEPNRVNTLNQLFLAYSYKGMYEEAVSTLEKIVAIRNRPDPERIAFFRHLASDNRSEAKRTLDQWEDLGFLNQARYYALIGEGDTVIEALRKELEQPGHNDSWINVWPEFDFLRDDPRFQDLLRRMNLLP